MLLHTFSELFSRDLLHLKREIEAYGDEQALWVVRGEIANSAGNLCLHLLGNLQHFIGAAIGHTGYVRDRDREFSEKNVPRQELLTRIDHTIEVVKSSLAKCTTADLEKDFPFEKRGEIVQTGHMLLHLFGHLSYHIGQINYHRRLLS